MPLQRFFLIFVDAVPCKFDPDYPDVVQITAVECKCCIDPDTFLQDNEFVYLLFYSSNTNTLNANIAEKFERLHEEWRHTKIAFGKVDVLIDRPIADRWLEPGQIPTNIMFRNGNPVHVSQDDFKLMLNKYHGSVEGQRWLLNRYFGEEAHFVKQLSGGMKKLQAALKVPSKKNKRTAKGSKKKNKKSKDHNSSSGIMAPKRKMVAFLPGLGDQHQITRAIREAIWRYYSYEPIQVEGDEVVPRSASSTTSKTDASTGENLESFLCFESGMFESVARNELGVAEISSERKKNKGVLVLYEKSSAEEKDDGAEYARKKEFWISASEGTKGGTKLLVGKTINFLSADSSPLRSEEL